MVVMVANVDQLAEFRRGVLEHDEGLSATELPGMNPTLVVTRQSKVRKVVVTECPDDTPCCIVTLRLNNSFLGQSQLTLVIIRRLHTEPGTPPITSAVADSVHAAIDEHDARVVYFLGNDLGDLVDNLRSGSDDNDSCLVNVTGWRPYQWPNDDTTRLQGHLFPAYILTLGDVLETR
jgi:hypothetical protein